MVEQKINFNRRLKGHKKDVINNESRSKFGQNASEMSEKQIIEDTMLIVQDAILTHFSSDREHA